MSSHAKLSYEWKHFPVRGYYINGQWRQYSCERYDGFVRNLVNRLQTALIKKRREYLSLQMKYNMLKKAHNKLLAERQRPILHTRRIAGVVYDNETQA